ncbi:MAG: hypothetical protein K8I27_14595 [Planctomycetes bacterium]|nr:hypothetical protein [Planctomycetota bacterium]
MRVFQLVAIVAFTALLHAQAEALPYHPSQAGYHDATVALAEYCLENKLFSEARLLCEKVSGDKAERAKEIIGECDGKDDDYTAESWGGYLDRREGVMKRRAAGATQAGLSARELLYLDPDDVAANETMGHKWLDGLGWLLKATHERLSPHVLDPDDDKPDREVTWEAPYVLVGEHFTLVTDLDWKRAKKYVGLLDRFHGVFFELLGDVIPDRGGPNVVWCCKDAATFVAFSKQVGHPMTENHGGLHVGALEAVLINAERCDYVGRKNKSHDNLARTMYHECAHRLVESGLRGRRGGWGSYELAGTTEHAWIVESIAIVFEGLEISASKHKLKGLEDQRTYIIDRNWKGKDGKVPALQPIFAQGFTGFAGASPIPNVEKYALAGAVGWYCLFEKAADYRKPYLTLLVDYYRTDTTRKDFDKRFGVKLGDFETAWREWVLKL